MTIKRNLIALTAAFLASALCLSPALAGGIAPPAAAHIA